MELRSSTATVADEYSANEYFWDQGWSADGLPIIAPTAERVKTFLDYAKLPPDHVIGSYQTRATALTAEKLAVNGVMAGCKPEYMPVLVAAFEGLTDPAFRMNHMASLGSPWPLIIVNGPVVKRLNMNPGEYVLGPGANRPNATIGRAVSLAMANCFAAKVGGVQRGTLGNPNRWSFLVAENEDTPWTPLHVQRGFKPEDSTVTVVGTMDGVVQFVTPNFSNPEGLCALMAFRIGNSFFTLGSYVVFIAPTFQQHFVDKGWSKDDITKYLLNNVKRSIASLKVDGRYGRYGYWQEPVPMPIEPGDESKFIHMKHDPELRKTLWHDGEWARKVDFLIVVCGGEAGNYGGYVGPYPLGTDPVTKKIRE